MKDLYDFLIGRLKNARKIAILGAGSFMKADDAAGVMVTERLKESFNEASSSSVRIYTGESAPENFTGEIKKFKPDHLILLDAADIKEEPGSIAFIQLEVIGGMTFSTHMLPVKIMLDYLVKETGCDITVIGIQPEDVTYNGKVTPNVIETVKYISEVLNNIIDKKRF